MADRTVDLGLFLAAPETLAPVLYDALPEHTLTEAPGVPLRTEPDYLFSEIRSLDDLGAQRWGVVVPEQGGDALLKLIAPLIEARAREQGISPEAVRRYRVSPGADPTDWIRNQLGFTDPKRPRYLLILGDLDQVSFELQSRLADYGYFPGRLAFDQPEHYVAYVRKVLEWEQPGRPTARARVVILTARTEGLDVNNRGYKELMQPARDRAKQRRDEGEPGFDFDLIEPPTGLPVSLAELQRVAKTTDAPTLLWTMSHGCGGDRRTSGRPVFAGETLDPEYAAAGPFVQGGIWFLFACFGAGTPAQSVYWHWLRRLQEDGDPTLRRYLLAQALAYLPSDGRPFVAPVPKAALANPDGPLAVVGHADYAWIYGFQDLRAAGVDPIERFLWLLSLLADPSLRCRLGRAFALFRKLDEIDASLINWRDREEASLARGLPSGIDPIEHGRLWMHRQDLANYMLLGDPAVRLPSRI